MFNVGDRVGEYEIIARLKAGGMATLFLGKRDGVSGFTRHVAIKVVHEHLATDETFVRMFVDEALLSARIQHPNVVHVEELRQVSGRHFLVMEYVHGCPLSELMTALRRKQRMLSAELATCIAVKVAEGLNAAHETTAQDGTPLMVVHRDVSPQNVLLAYKGHVKLIDFGVAKAAGRASQTTGGSLKGKIRYMSPEQAIGGAIDRRTDVYALGVVLWEMLTNRRAFSAENDFALLELVRDPNVPLASTHNPGVPPALDQAIQKAMAKRPEDRFQSAQEMRKALARAVPSALALDASDLEMLLAATLGESIRRELRQLPESLTGSAEKALLEPNEEIVYTMTVSSPGLSVPSEVTAPSVPSAELIRGGDTVAMPEGTGPGGTPIGVAISTPPARSRAPVFVGLGAALVLLALGGGVGIWRLAGSGEAVEMQVTELPSLAPAAAAEPLEAGEEPTETQDPDGVAASHGATDGEAEPVEHPSADTPVEEPTDEEATTAALDEATTGGDDTTEDDTTEEPAPRPRVRRRPRPRNRPRTTPEPAADPDGVFLADDF